MQKFLLLFSFIFISTILIAEQFTDPKDALKMLDESGKSFKLEILEKEEPFKDTKTYDKLNTPDYYQISSNNFISLHRISLKEEEAKFFKKAEDLFLKKKFKEAREYYEKTLEKAPDFFIAKTYIAQMYRLEGNYKDSKKWYLDAIKSNYIDYMAHYGLSTVYMEEKDYRNALNEIVIAHILNRNNPRIIANLKIIANANNFVFDDEYFTPKIKFTENKNGLITLTAYKEEWAWYGICQTLWKYLDGYREKRSKDASGSEDISEETKECLLYVINQNMLPELEKKPDKENKNLDPQVKRLINAYKTGMLLSFIYYEEIFPEYPITAYAMPQETLENIKKYIYDFKLSPIKTKNNNL